jgi:hypothetical protein
MDKARDEQISKRARSLSEPDWYFSKYSYTGEDGDTESYGCSRSYFEWKRQLAAFSEPLRIEYADRKWAPQKAYLDSLDHQAKSSEELSRVSPAGLFRSIAAALCATDRHAYEAEIDQAREYRETFIRYLQGKNAFSSFRWLTAAPPGSFKTADELAALRSGGKFKNLRAWGDWALRQKDFMAPFNVLNVVKIPGEEPDDYPYMDVSDMPRFLARPHSLLSGLAESAQEIGLLLIEAIFLFYLSYVAFLRYDVR